MFGQWVWALRLVLLLVPLAVLLAEGDLSGRPSEAAQTTPQPQVTPQRGAGPVGRSPRVLGDINNDGIVDIRDYGIWRTNFGATDCGNPADLDGNCIVDVRDYGVWRTNFGQTGPTATPTSSAPLPGRAYVTNSGSNSVSVIDTTTNTVVGTPIPVGSGPHGIGVDPTVHRAFVANFGGSVGDVTVIDTQTNAVVGTPIVIGGDPEGVGVDPTVHRAYVADPLFNKVVVIDTTTNTIVGASIPVILGPYAVGVDP